MSVPHAFHKVFRRITNEMNISRHFYAIGGIMAILTAASFGSGHYKAAAPASSNVLVMNAPNQPIPMKDGHTPITVETPEIVIANGTGGSGYVPLYTVPAGKRLVIQTIYGIGQSTFGTPIALGVIKVVSGPTVHSFPLPFESKQVSDAQTGENEFVLSNVSLEVEPGSVMTAAIELQNYNSGAYVGVGFSGYLENAS